MFNNEGGYSLADIAAATGGANDGFFGGNNGWWIILLFLFAWGGWGNGGWNNGGGNNVAPLVYGLDNMSNNADRFYDLNSSILTGFANTTAAVNAGTSAIQSDLCNMGMQNLQSTNSVLQAINANTVAGMQNAFGLTNQLSNMQAAQQLANCQTDDNVTRNFATLNYNLATEACADRNAVSTASRDIIENANNNTRAILDFLVQDRITALTTENQALKGQISQSEQNAYLISQLKPCPGPAYIVPNPNGCGCGSQTYYGYGVGNIIA